MRLEQAVLDERGEAPVDLAGIGPGGLQRGPPHRARAVAQLLQDGAAHLAVGAVPRLAPARRPVVGRAARRRPRRTGRATGHSSHLGERAWQTRAPSSITATFQVADVAGSSGTSEAASADSATVSAGAAWARPSTARASTRRTLVSTTVVRRPNAKAATAAAV